MHATIEKKRYHDDQNRQIWHLLSESLAPPHVAARRRWDSTESDRFSMRLHTYAHTPLHFFAHV